MTFAAFVKQSMLHAYVSDIPSRPLDIAASTLLASESYQGICGKTTDQQCTQRDRVWLPNFLEFGGLDWILRTLWVRPLPFSQTSVGSFETVNAHKVSFPWLFPKLVVALPYSRCTETRPLCLTRDRISSHHTLYNLLRPPLCHILYRTSPSTHEGMFLNGSQYAAVHFLHLHLLVEVQRSTKFTSMYLLRCLSVSNKRWYC